MADATITTGGVAILMTSSATLIAALGGLAVGHRTRTDARDIKISVNGTTQTLLRRIEELEAALRNSSQTPPRDGSR
jgi:hypothetical protein